MTASTLSRRPSLWADEPVMRDGRVMDAALKALGRATDVQEQLLSAVKSCDPDVWLRDAETFAAELLGHIRSMRSTLGASMEKVT